MSTPICARCGKSIAGEPVTFTVGGVATSYHPGHAPATVAPGATCEPRILSEHDLSDVLASYQKLYREGRHGEPPDPALIRRVVEHGSAWVLAELPLSILNYQSEEESSEQRMARARAYAARTGPFPPGTAVYSGWRRSGKAYVTDGNHRALAAHYRGDCAVRMFMPKAEYDAVVSDARWRGLL
jgi:hypothetical protein